MTDYAKIERIWAAVTAIPAGKVATYGQVAERADLPGRARLVGRVLRELPEHSPVPWFRVIAAGGRISERGSPDSEEEQRLLLEDEGVEFSATGRIDLTRFGWRD